MAPTTPVRPHKSAAPSRATSQRQRKAVSARGPRVPAEDAMSAEDAEAEAAAAAQSEALERLLKQDFRPLGLEPPQDTYFTVEDEGLLSGVQSLFSAVVVTEGEGAAEMCVCYASEGFLELSGFEQNDIMTQEITAVLTDGSDAEATDAVREAFRGSAAVNIEVMCARKDGSKFKNTVTVLPIIGSGGSVEKVLSLHCEMGGSCGGSGLGGAAEEQSRLRRAERLERLIAACLFTSTDAPEAPVVDFGKGGLEALGLRDGQLRGKSVLSVTGPDSDRMAQEGLLLAHMDKKPATCRLLLYRGDGSSFWSFCVTMPLARSTGPTPGRSIIRRREGSMVASANNLRDNLGPGSPIKARNAQVVVEQHMCVFVDITRVHLKKIGKWQMGKVIGRGAQGVVRLGRGPSGERVAVKMVDASSFRNIGDIDRVQDEIAVLCKLKHKNIIRLVDTHFVNNAFYFAMEWAAGGPLVDYIYKQPSKRLQEPEARIIFTQIVEALDYCHRRRVVHRDLKPENVLLDENNLVKIADFGLAAITAPFDDSLTLMCGTPEFTAPEIVAGREYDGASVDIWSLGVMLYEFLSGYLPFKAPDQKELFRLIVKGEMAKLPNDVTMEAADLISNMLQVKVESRLSLDEIQQHSWYVGKSTTYVSANAQAAPVQESLRLVLPNDSRSASHPGAGAGAPAKSTASSDSSGSAAPTAPSQKTTSTDGGKTAATTPKSSTRMGTYRVGPGAAASKAAAASGGSGSGGASVGPYGRTRVVAPRARSNITNQRSH